MQSLRRLLAAGAVSLAAATTLGTPPTAPQGVITVREYLNIAGTAIPDLTNNVKFPNSPDVVDYSPRFEWPTGPDDFTNPPGDVKNNYGIQIIGYFIPDTTGPYTFYFAADDNARLFLSTDATPANKKLIAVETAWSPVRGWDSTAGASDVTAKNSSTYAASQWPGGGAAINLTAGRLYYIEALVKEGGGGDNLAVSIDGTSPIPGSMLATIDKATGPVTISSHPANATVGENLSATFAVEPNGTPPYRYQWQRAAAGGAFSDIADATNKTYTIASAPIGDNNTQYKVVVTGPTGSATSNPATLTISTDVTPPTIVSVRGTPQFNAAMVTFSEPVTQATAQALANYAFSGGLTISAATQASPTTVRLTTGTQAEGATHTLTVNNIKDASVAGNTIAANSQATLKTFVFSRGFAAWERWNDLNGDTGNIDTFVDNLVNPDFRPPDLTGTSTYVGHPRGAADNYGARAFAWFTPPQNGNYTFFFAADDQSYLFLSTDATTASKKKIAAQPQWGDQNQWIDPDTTENRSDQYTAPEWPGGNTIALNSTTRYYLELVFREGGGGDGGEVYYKLDSAADPANGTAPNTVGAVIGVYADPSGASVNITQQPQSKTVVQNASTTFTVAATGSSTTLMYQWQKAPAGGNFADIAGANGTSFTTAPIPIGENGSRYRVVITVPGLSTNSAEATVTVTSDTAPPTIVAAQRRFAEDNRVLVRFNEILDTATANAAANYTINNGITVSAAVLQADNRSVLLSTSPIASGVTNTLTVNAVKDAAGNTIAANSQAPIGFQESILLVTADPGPLNFPGDQAVYDHLIGLGYDVQITTGTDVADDGSTANGKVAVVQSSSLGSGTTVAAAGGSKFLNLTIPVMLWEASNIDDMMFAAAIGTTVASLTDIDIVDATSPLTAGLPAGLTTVVTSPQTFSVGTAPVGAHIVATAGGGPVLYYYDRGERGFQDFVMPGRRAFFFFQDNTAAFANENGWKIFDATLNWLLNKQTVTPPGQPKATIARSAGNVTITSDSGGTVQASPTLAPATWTDIGAAPQTVPATTGTRFFRIKK